MKKLLNKSIAMLVAASTITTGCMLNVCAGDNKNESKGGGFGQCLKYIIPTGFAFSALGYVAGNLFPVEEVITPKAKVYNNGMYDLVELIKYPEVSRKFVKNYFTNQWSKPVKYRKFESYEINGRLVTVSNFRDSEGCHKRNIISYLESGFNVIFLGNILHKGTNDERDMNNLIFLMELQRLYPNQVIILKGVDDLLPNDERKIHENLYKYVQANDMDEQDSVAKIRSFIGSLPLICTIKLLRSQRKYFFSSNVVSQELVDKSKEEIEAGKFRVKNTTNKNQTIDCRPLLEKLGAEGCIIGEIGNLCSVTEFVEYPRYEPRQEQQATGFTQENWQ